MVSFVIGFICLIAGLIVPFCLPRKAKAKIYASGRVKFRSLKSFFIFQLPGLLLFFFFSIFLNSTVNIDQNKIGHMKRIYFGDSMAPGQIVALPGQNGPQAKTLSPGYQFIFMVNFLYDVEEKDVLNVPKGHYCILTAKDGKPLRNGQYLADEWPEAEVSKYLDALYFLGYQSEDGKPRGQKGPQLTVLTPGSYRFNWYLFNVDCGYNAIDIKAGFVGVVKSNVGQKYEGAPIVPDSIIESYIEASKSEIEEDNIKKALNNKETQKVLTGKENKKVLTKDEAREKALKVLSMPLVPKGYQGIWTDVLLPGKYYFNEMAYQVVDVDTRIQTWNYQGGYTKKEINLTINSKGEITQKETSKEIPIPPNAADKAIIVKSEGWEFPIDARILVQVTPTNAPFVVATVGGIQQVEDKIITPTFKSVMRNVIGNKDKVKVLDTLYKRTSLEGKVEKSMIPEGLKAGVIIKEVRWGDPGVPPALLIPDKRKQIASQLKDTFEEEEKAQNQRIKMEKTKAEADQQHILMKAEINKQAAKMKKEEDKLFGEGQKLKMQETAEGQKALKSVFGPEKAFALEVLKLKLNAAVKNPAIIKTPQFLIIGDRGGSLNSAASILGASNFNLNMTGSKK